VIDDWAVAPLSEPERRDFREICEDRYQVRSLMLTSHVPVSRLARTDSRSHAGRWHPRPAGASFETHHAVVAQQNRRAVSSG
jgi:hypothetical protein